MTKTQNALMVISIGLFATPAFAFTGTVVPEPASLTLVATGIAGLLVGVRFIRRK